MAHNVLGGTLNLALSIYLSGPVLRPTPKVLQRSTRLHTLAGKLHTLYFVRLDRTCFENVRLWGFALKWDMSASGQTGITPTPVAATVVTCLSIALHHHTAMSVTLCAICVICTSVSITGGLTARLSVDTWTTVTLCCCSLCQRHNPLQAAVITLAIWLFVHSSY